MNILYGVLGEGMGHAIRSLVIIKHLLKNHDVQVITSNRAYELLNSHFPGKVNKINGFNLVYENGNLSMPKTSLNVITFMAKNTWPNIKRYLEIQRKFDSIGFKPDIAFSDFESFVFIYSKLHGIPLVSFDNMQILSRCRLDFPVPLKEYYNFFMAKKIVQLKVIHCNQYMITTFFHLPFIKRDTSFVPPVLRDEILSAEAHEANHILVYQTSSTNKQLTEILQKIPDETFYVYGFKESSIEGNVIIKEFSEEEFIRDLSGAKAVITNGGFTLISEALYLKKPICSIPVKNQFEQFVNAHYLEKLGYGKHLQDFRPDRIKDFIANLGAHKKALENYKQNGNEETFDAIEKMIARLT